MVEEGLLRTVFVVRPEYPTPKSISNPVYSSPYFLTGGCWGGIGSMPNPCTTKLSAKSPKKVTFLYSVWLSFYDSLDPLGQRGVSLRRSIIEFVSKSCKLMAIRSASTRSFPMGG